MKTLQDEASKAGAGYRTATDKFVPDLGFKKIFAGAKSSDGDISVLPLKPRVADVARNLLSVTELNARGFTVVLDKHNSFFVRKSDGAKFPIRYTGVAYETEFGAYSPVVGAKLAREESVRQGWPHPF